MQFLRASRKKTARQNLFLVLCMIVYQSALIPRKLPYPNSPALKLRSHIPGYAPVLLELWSLKCHKWLIFLYFLLLTAKISHCLGKIFKHIWRISISSFRKYYGLLTFELPLTGCQPLKKQVLVFFADSAVFSIFLTSKYFYISLTVNMVARQMTLHYVLVCKMHLYTPKMTLFKPVKIDILFLYKIC